MLLALVAASMLQVAAPARAPAPARLDPARAGPAALVEALEAAELRFFSEWGEAFRLSQRRPEPYPMYAGSALPCWR